MPRNVTRIARITNNQRALSQPGCMPGRIRVNREFGQFAGILEDQFRDSVQAPVYQPVAQAKLVNCQSPFPLHDDLIAGPAI
ncbi:MAG: hypothetical protein WBO47_13760 [Gammaproteobacteria bacterium]